jgi:hypothetical protein
MVRSIFLVLVSIMLILSSASVGRGLRADTISGRVRVIYMGKIVGSPFPVLSIEPSLLCTAVFACTKTQRPDVIKRSLRNYFPRTYGRYLDHDVVIFDNAHRDSFRTDHLRWMRDGVIEGGQGISMVGGAESFQSGWWTATEVADILPCEMMDQELSLSGGSVLVIDHDDEFMASLPFDTLGNYGFFRSANNILPRTGANHVADLVGVHGTMPFLMWWDVGQGRTMAQSGPWHPTGGNFMRWEYFGDYAINMMLFLAGRKLPDDIELVYLVRRRMRQVTEGLNTLYSLIEMIEKFGGSSFELSKVVASIQGKRQQATDLYVEANMEDSLHATLAVLEMVENAMEQALRTRDEAAFWIFVTEWAIVTGTSLITGVTIWLLMIRRSLYREVDNTRLRRM